MNQSASCITGLHFSKWFMVIKVFKSHNSVEAIHQIKIPLKAASKPYIGFENKAPPDLKAEHTR